MKIEWKKCEKEIYGTKSKAEIINLPKQKYLMIKGKGNPNESDFSNRVAALFSLSYKIKMSVKKDIGVDYTVYPLEGLWKVEDSSKKADYEYILMIRQPDFIDIEFFSAFLKRQKSMDELWSEIEFQQVQEGSCVQMLHVGLYEEEWLSFEKMRLLAEKEGLCLMEGVHKEIYLNNPIRTKKENLKTILRLYVKKLCYF